MASCMEARPRGRVPPPRPPALQANTEQTDFKSLQTLHDKAYKHIEKGLADDENENIENAVSNYRAGLQLLDKALRVDCEKLMDSEEKKDAAKQMQQKMTKTKLQIEYRLQSIQVQRNVTSRHPSTPMELDQPPSYEDVMSESGSESMSDTTFQSLGDSIMSDESSEVFVADATEVYNIPEGVQIFFITPEGYVSAPSYPSALKIFKFVNESTPSIEQHPPAFLQVGSWVYPLQTGASPALHASNGAYIFPDTAERPGSAVGLMLPDTMSTADKDVFESVLSSMTMMHQEEVVETPLEERVLPSAPAEERETTPEEREAGKEEEESTSSKISKGIAVASNWISWGIEKGAEKAGQYIKIGSDRIKAKLKPEERTKDIDPRVQQGVQYVRRGTHVAVKVSSYVVKKLGEATMAVGREVAPHLRKHGEKLLPDSMKGKSSDGKSKVDGVLDVAGAGLAGFSTIYMTLEAAAKALGKGIANETVTLVDHKYGSQAGLLTENGLYAIGNAALAVNNVDNLGIKAVAKRAAKDTGKALLTDVKDRKKGNVTANIDSVSYSKKQ